MNLKAKLLAALLLLSLAAVPARAEVKLPALISDNMVLQRGIKARLWGWAEPGEKVTVAFRGQSSSALADQAGRWSIYLPPMEAGGPFEMTIYGKNALTIRNIMVGEVWVCSGQSNMAWPVSYTVDAKEEMASANYPAIRMFTVANAVSAGPEADCRGSWTVVSPETIGRNTFSGVGYYFARELHQKLGLPVGMIHTSWSGSMIEPWIDRAAYAAEAGYRPLLEGVDKSLADYAEAFYQRVGAEVLAWKLAADRAIADRRPLPLPPMLSLAGDPRNPSMPTAIFNAMVAPLTPYAIRGAIWYQGESNARRAQEYRKLLPMMIRSWRRAWGEGDFPFLIVQLANFTPPKPEPAESFWAELREAQLMTSLSVPKTGLAVAIDIGEANNIHPLNKQEVGKRLALAARAIAYGESLVYSGPIYRSRTIEGNKIRIHFKHVDGGLVAKGGEGLTGFAIAGEDRKFVWAEAVIEGETVVVSSPEAARPAAARYAWADNPACNLYNRAGLPASPFRTDDWPGAAEGSK
jgi:sialate O-acetylesterase